MKPETAVEIGVEGYIFLYPLVLMEVTRRQATNVTRVGERPLRGPMDTFIHGQAFPRAEFRDVVRPNFDTLYSACWLDLRKEPRIISVPAAGDNYYLMPLYDMWGEVFACPGVRTTGSAAITFAVCPPGWKGNLPEGVHGYECPTQVCWVVGRTQASPQTYDMVHAFQAGMMVARLSEWGSTAHEMIGKPDPTIDDETPPLRQVFGMDAGQFFGLASELMKSHKPHAMDYPVLDRLAQIGFVAGETFDVHAADSVVSAALSQAVPAAQKKITKYQLVLGTPANGWLLNTTAMGTFGTWYLKRATVELVGLGANLPEDAIYPVVFADSEGQPLDGANRYIWHMTAEQIPPVNAFWSMTLYDAEGFQVANELDRFAIGDRDALEFNDDGSLDILIQHERPAQGTSNWLPAPECAFTLTARLYWPKPEALDGKWLPPAISRVGSAAGVHSGNRPEVAVAH